MTGIMPRLRPSANPQHLPQVPALSQAMGRGRGRLGLPATPAGRYARPMAPGTHMTWPITVAVVEGEHAVRTLFEQAVRSNPRLSLAFSAGTAIELAQARPAQAYLVDLGLPDRDGSDLIRWISARQPQASVMVVTVFGDDNHVVSSFEAGAVGYLLKDTPADEIARLIVELHEGGSPISPSVACQRGIL